MSDELKSEYRQVRFRCGERDFPSSFHILTAFNPDGQTANASANEQADENLRRRLIRRELPRFRVTGGSPDFVHSEPGYGISCTLAEALELAREYRQDAIFTVREGTVFLVSAKCDDPDLEEIGLWTDLWVGR